MQWGRGAREGCKRGGQVAHSPFLNAGLALIDCSLLFLHFECRYDGLSIHTASTHSRPQVIPLLLKLLQKLSQGCRHIEQCCSPCGANSWRETIQQDGNPTLLQAQELCAVPCCALLPCMHVPM